MSKLRCKPGDLAVVVGPCTTPGLEGRIVMVERLLGPDDVLENGARINMSGTDAVWLIKSAVRGQKLPNSRVNGKLESLWARGCEDKLLRPIRPNDGEDESLSWSRPLEAA